MSKRMKDDDWMVLLGGANGLNECKDSVNERMLEMMGVGFKS